MSSLEERAKELLVDRVTEGLDRQDDSELQALLPQCPELDIESFELAAAAIALACIDQEDPIPAGLHRELASTARRVFGT